MLGKMLIPLLLLSMLLGTAAARAESVAPGSGPYALEEEFQLEGEGAGEQYGEFEAEEEEMEEGGEEASAEEECEEATEEFEEGEIEREELEEACQRQHKRLAHGEPPEKCVLRSAHGHAAIDTRSNALKLTIGYTTYEPTGAMIDIEGLPHEASLHHQLNRSGVIRKVVSLPDGQSPKRLTLEIRIPSAEGPGCPSRRLVLFPR